MHCLCVADVFPHEGTLLLKKKTNFFINQLNEAALACEHATPLFAAPEQTCACLLAAPEQMCACLHEALGQMCACLHAALDQTCACLLFCDMRLL